MFSYKDKITVTRTNPVDWNKTIIYDLISAEVEINDKWWFWWDNSKNSPIADYFIFLSEDKKNIKIWDIITFEDYFWDEQKIKVISRDYVNFVSTNWFIELLTKLV